GLRELSSQGLILRRGQTRMTWDEKAVVSILYRNHRGETSVRRILPIGIRFSSSEWHPIEQWLLDAYDLDKQAERSFALADVIGWGVAGSPTGPAAQPL